MGWRLVLVRCGMLALLLCGGCGDDEADPPAGGAGDAADAPDITAGDSPDEPQPPGETGATETNVLGAPCEGDADCPLSFCGDPVPGGSRVCAAPGLILQTDSDADAGV